MVIINTTEDFIRAMDENPDWLEAARSRLLTRELLELPARFAEHARENETQFAALIRRMDEHARENKEQFAALIRRMDEHAQENKEEFAAANRRMDEYQRANDARMDEHERENKEEFARIHRRLDRFEGDMGRFRSRHASESARARDFLIAKRLGCDLRKTLSIRDLDLIASRADTTGIPANQLDSFLAADLVMDAVRIDTGERCYIAVEISYTVNGRDTSRAVRNAEFLRRFTKIDAIPAVAGVRKDNRVDEDLAANGVFWYQLTDDDLETG